MSEIRIRNHKQACAYVNNGVQPIRLEYVNGRMVYIFIEADTKNIWKRWLAHEELL